MRINRQDKFWDVFLGDDGTVDTVLVIKANGHTREFHFDSEYAAEFRSKDGTMYAKGLKDMAEKVIDEMELEEWEEFWPTNKNRGCDQCEMVSIQGLPCHESGCPNAWQRQTLCKNCGGLFLPEERGQRCCDLECTRAYLGNPSVSTDRQIKVTAKTGKALRIVTERGDKVLESPTVFITDETYQLGNPKRYDWHEDPTVMPGEITAWLGEDPGKSPVAVVQGDTMPDEPQEFASMGNPGRRTGYKSASNCACGHGRAYHKGGKCLWKQTTKGGAYICALKAHDFSPGDYSDIKWRYKGAPNGNPEGPYTGGEYKLTIGDIKAKHTGYFFDSSAMRFFRSRVLGEVYQGPGGVYFVTSEQYNYDSPRLYTVRRFIKETGDVRTVGDFNALSKSAAQSKAYRLAKGTEKPANENPGREWEKKCHKCGRKAIGTISGKPVCDTHAGKPKTNPPKSVMVGERVTLIECEGGKCAGNYGKALGLPDGTIRITGFFKNVPTGDVRAIEYMDEGKRKAAAAREVKAYGKVKTEGYKRAGLPWRHNFEKTGARLRRVQGGVLVYSVKNTPLWGME
jgi:hypothetical protein